MSPRFPSRAKTLRASEDARREGAAPFVPAVSRFVPAHRRYTPELLASGRVRYEQTSESVAAIAADFDVLPGSFRRMARKFNWVRFGTGMRHLPEAARLEAEAQALEDLLMPQPEPEPEPDTPLSALDRLERAVLAEISSVELMRKRIGLLPKRGSDAVRTARTLSSLTDTLNKLQRMRCVAEGAPAAAPAEEKSTAEEIEEFRAELARRIESLAAEGEAEAAARNDALTDALWPD
jgi:hypothetical protein